MKLNLRISHIAVAAGLALVGLSSQAQTFVDISSDGAPVVQSFSAGTYSISFIDALYSAYSVRSTGSGPQQLFRTLFTVNDGTTSTNFGSYTEYTTTAAAVAAANAMPSTFTLLAPTTVSFFIPDYPTWDNSGGVSLSISAAPVPEPGTYALMLAGLAAVGFIARRRHLDA